MHLLRLLVTALLSAGLWVPVCAESFETAHYRIELTSQCEEGEITCGNVLYVGTELKSGKSLKLRGSTLHAQCEDHITPCRFLGYRFMNQGWIYLVTADAFLEVIRPDGKRVLREKARLLNP